MKKIKFKIPNKYDVFLKKILHNIGNDKTIWIIEDDEIFLLKNGSILESINLFERDIYSNDDFKNIIDKTHYAIFAEIKLIDKSENIEEIRLGINKNYILKISIIDNIFVEVYSEDKELLNIIKANAIENNFTDINEEFK